MPIGLIRLITKQKMLKTCSVKGIKQHYLDSNQHHALVGSPGILQTKRHHVVAIHTSGCDE